MTSKNRKWPGKTNFDVSLLKYLSDRNKTFTTLILHIGLHSDKVWRILNFLILHVLPDYYRQPLLRLQALVAKLNAEGLRNLYQKKELQKLCDAYNVRYLSRWNKGKLANDLAQAILQNEAIPAPQVLSIYRSELSGEDHVNSVPVIRIRRLCYGSTS
jgi:hypothetical protein